MWRAFLLLVVGCGRINFDDGTNDLAGPRDIVALSAHGNHSCMLDNDGSLWCWGDGSYGQLGGDTIATQPLPRRVPGVPPMMRVDVGAYTTFAIDRSNRVWAWGQNDLGQLGIGTVTAAEPQPQLIDLAEPQQIAASEYFTCALTRTGTVSCWGFNRCGQLGDGTFVARQAPGPTVMPLAGARALAVHDVFACAIDGAEQLRCWGTPVDLDCVPWWSTAELVAGVPRVVQLEGGCDMNLCALDETGAIWCLGQNTYGQLGDGTTAYSRVFKQVLDFGASRRAAEIAVGADHICARTADDHVYCWGDNTSGELGIDDRSLMTSATPRALPFFDGSIPIDDLEAGCAHTCARSGADLYCWGSNYSGGVGDGTAEDRYAPVRVGIALR